MNKKTLSTRAIAYVALFIAMQLVLEVLCELPRLTLRLEVRVSCFNHHCLAGNLTVLSGLNDVYKRYIRLIPSLYVLY